MVVGDLSQRYRLELLLALSKSSYVNVAERIKVYSFLKYQELNLDMYAL